MKKFILTLCLCCFFLATFAGKFVIIYITEINSLEALFKDKDLKIHYYCDEYILATANNINYNGTIILDENAFTDVSSYSIVYCNEAFKEQYLSSIFKKDNNSLIETHSVATILYSGNDFFIMKILSNDFMPATNDGMIMVRDIQARLVNSSFTYPVITEPDENILYYLSQVSINRMMTDIQALQNFETRYCMHPNIFIVRDWLKEKYKPLGLEVNFHNFPYHNNDNVIAIQYGTEFPDEYVVCGAHYDTYSDNLPDVAPGADDNASGTAGIIEIAKILSQYSFKRSIIYCAFSAEELGLIGSGYYAGLCAEKTMNIVAYFNMDMIGFLKQGNEIKIHFSNPVVAKILADYCENICEVYFPEIPFSYNHYMSGSDHRSFINCGYMGITSIEYDFRDNTYYHKTNDLIGLGLNNSKLVETFVSANLASIATLAIPDNQSITELNHKINIYPNPTTGKLTINNGQFTINNVEVFDIYGKCHLSLVTCHASSITLNIPHLSSGLYLIKITTEEGIVTKKIIKQ